MVRGALSGVMVLDLTHHIAGPYCTRLLAGMGADVVKVEKPGVGDVARGIGPFPNDEPHLERSGLFLYLNANKKSITLNLKTATGVKIFKELVKDADVIVENFEPRVMLDLGLDHEILSKINPRLVVTSISNFGQTGPYRDYKATEVVALAVSGLMYITGAFDREPLKYGLSQGQYIAGSVGASATLSALLAREEAEVGQHVDVSIMESIMQGMMMHIAYYSHTGAVMRRTPKVRAATDEIMATKDGYIAPIFHGFLDWGLMASFLQCPELDDPKFHSDAGRRIFASELNAILAPVIAQWGKHELFHAAQEWRLPFGVVQTPEDLVRCPQLKDRGYFVEMDHPVAGRLTYPGAPFKMSETPWQAERPAPLLGEHNEEIYCGRLGYSKQDLVILKERGII